MTEFSPWLPLTAASIESMPDEAAVYEIGTLVRSVLLIGTAAPGALRNTLGSHMHPHGVPHPPGRLYFRYKIAGDPAQEARRRLEQYRHTHRGTLPRWQQLFPRTHQNRLQGLDAKTTGRLLAAAKPSRPDQLPKSKIII